MDGKANILTGTENVLIVVAAGNDNGDACDQSPARNGGVITVGASTNQDARATFSNYGRCLDIFAPGLNIRSLSAFSDTGTAVLSGTSMAAPMVSGVVALWLDQNPKLEPAEMFDTILRNSTQDVLKAIGDQSPNRLLFQPFNEGYDYVAEDTSLLSMLSDDWMILVGAVFVMALFLFVYYSQRKKAPRQETLLIGGAGVNGGYISSEEAMNLSDLMPYNLSEVHGTGHYVNMDGYRPPQDV